MNRLIVREGARRVDTTTCPPCLGTCNQGRDCPTPQACELPLIDLDMPTPDFALWELCLYGVVALIALAFAAGALFAVWPVIAAMTI